MDNLIKLNEDKVVRGGIEVYFKNYAIGSYGGDTMCMVYIWDKYVMTLPEAFYTSRGAEEMKEQFEFIDSIIADEIDNSSKEIENKSGEIQIFFPFVTATIEPTRLEETPYQVTIEKVKDEVTFGNFGFFSDLAEAKLEAVKEGYRMSKDAQTEAATEIWRKE